MTNYDEIKQDRYIQKSGWTQDRADESLYNVYFSIYQQEVENVVEWNLARLDCIDNAQENAFAMGYDLNPSEPIVGSCFLGTVFAIMPSGKFWTFWADSNVDRIEQIKDTAYWDALSAEAESRDMWIENSEYDPCDVMVCCWVESEDN